MSQKTELPSRRMFVAALTAVIQMAAPLFYVAMVVNAF
jgi:hypothetical protein